MTRRFLCFFLLVVALWRPSPVIAAKFANEIPCVLFQDGQFSFDAAEKCRQLTTEQVKSNNKRLLELKSLRSQAKTYAEMKTAYDALGKLAEKDKQIHAKEASELKKEAGRQAALAKTWETAFVRLKNERLPPRHWTEHPAFWFGVGFLVAGAVTGVTVAIVLAR